MIPNVKDAEVRGMLENSIADTALYIPLDINTAAFSQRVETAAHPKIKPHYHPQSNPHPHQTHFNCDFQLQASQKAVQTHDDVQATPSLHQAIPKALPLLILPFLPQHYELLVRRQPSQESPKHLHVKFKIVLPFSVFGGIVSQDAGFPLRLGLR